MKLCCRGNGSSKVIEPAVLPFLADYRLVFFCSYLGCYFSFLLVFVLFLVITLVVVLRACQLPNMADSLQHNLLRIISCHMADRGVIVMRVSARLTTSITPSQNK